MSKFAAGLVLFVCVSLAFAAAPPAAPPSAWLKLIDQLASDDEAVVRAAEKKLLDLGEGAIPFLRKVGRTHDDADVRLRAVVLAAAIARELLDEVRKFTGHTDGVLVLAVSPDGKSVVSGSAQSGSETAARVWDVGTGNERFTLEGHTGAVLGVAWSKDGSRILTGSGDGSLIHWDATTGKRLKTLTGHETAIYHVALSPDGKQAVSCDANKSLRIWDLTTGKHLLSDASASAVRGVSAMPDGKHFVAAAQDGSVLLISLATGKLVRKMDDRHVNGAWFAFGSPDGKWIASCGANNVVWQHDAATGKRVKSFVGHTDTVHALAWSPDGKRLLSGGHDKTIRLWDVATAKELRRFDAHGDVVTSAAFLPGGRQAITASYDKTLRLWNVGR